MRVRWRGLELPSQVVIDKEVSTQDYGRFVIEPFERGFGTTVGNSLRRILLSSLEGAAVTSVKMTGVTHEFMAVDGVMEDITDVILNIKSLIVKLEGDGPKTMKVTRTTKGQIKASDIETDPAIEIINTDLVLATLSDDIPFTIEMTVRSGRGYTTAAENTGEEQEIGVIPVDSLFSPVSRVRYKTEDTRVGHRVNYDRLVMEIWTKGTITPDMALVEAAKIMRKHLNPFVLLTDTGTDVVVGEGLLTESAGAGIDEDLKKKLDMSIQELELSVRALNCLEAADIATLGELIGKSEADLLKVRSFGKTSLREVKRKLADMGLSLGMNLSEAANS